MQFCLNIIFQGFFSVKKYFHWFWFLTFLHWAAAAQDDVTQGTGHAEALSLTGK